MLTGLCSVSAILIGPWFSSAPYIFPKFTFGSLRSTKKIDDYFYILKNQDISNDEIYFLTHNDVFDTFDEDKLGNFDNFTDTFPEFRANLKLYLNEGGFSSYQSEYPYGMVKKKGLILSSISSSGPSPGLSNLGISKA